MTPHPPPLTPPPEPAGSRACRPEQRPGRPEPGAGPVAVLCLGAGSAALHLHTVLRLLQPGPRRVRRPPRAAGERGAPGRGENDRGGLRDDAVVPGEIRELGLGEGKTGEFGEILGELIGAVNSEAAEIDDGTGKDGS